LTTELRFPAGARQPSNQGVPELLPWA